ncbi:MAG: hypothetical protein JWP92_839 [Caulobacter sp.]|nr:hypothetical protein [Caulobacter sp.]
MVEVDTVRRLALSLPEVVEGGEAGRLAFSVGGKGIAWTYLARAKPKGPRLPRPEVLAVRCPLDTKEMLIEAAPERFFDDDHYRGYPAVLVRLEAIEADELLSLLSGGWRATAPRALVKRVDGLA